MSVHTYHHCYRILGVRAPCDWNALRLAYRRRVRECHPDLMAAKDANQPARDDEFKTVVLAYRSIARFRKIHGELPPPWLVADDGPAGPGSAGREPPCGDTPAGVSVAQPARSRRWLPSRMHQAVFAAFIAGVGIAAIAGHASRNAETGSQQAAAGRLAVGMDAQSVVDLQGVPNYTKGSIWFYGDSGVIFDEGCVVGWENQSPFPLRTVTPAVYFASSSEELQQRTGLFCRKPKSERRK